MKLPQFHGSDSPVLPAICGRERRRSGRSRGGLVAVGARAGSAVLVVFMLLAVVGALIVANSRILYALKTELRLVDQEQQRKFAPPAAAVPGTPDPVAVDPSPPPATAP